MSDAVPIEGATPCRCGHPRVQHFLGGAGNSYADQPCRIDECECAKFDATIVGIPGRSKTPEEQAADAARVSRALSAAEALAEAGLGILEHLDEPASLVWSDAAVSALRNALSRYREASK